jgi:hypothetical protein
MGSRPSAPVTYRPTPTAPVIYQSVIPEADFQLARDYVDELKTERKKKRDRLESAGFGASDMQKRQDQYMKAEQDMYKASLPKTSLGSSGSTGTTP